MSIYYCYNTTCNNIGIPIIKDIMKEAHSFRRNAITSMINITGNIVGTTKLFGNNPTSALGNY